MDCARSSFYFFAGRAAAKGTAPIMNLPAGSEIAAEFTRGWASITDKPIPGPNDRREKPKPTTRTRHGFDWTTAEDRKLKRMWEQRHDLGVPAIARLLGRSQKAVIVRITRLRIKRSAA